MTTKPIIEPPKGVTRRSFIKLCTAVAGVLGLGEAGIPAVARALTSSGKPPVAWLHFSECTGCSESFLRVTQPSLEDIILDTVTLDYHETIMAAAGIQAEENLDGLVADHSGEFLCICEGAVPTADGGVYGTIGGRTMLEIANHVLPNAKAVIAYGTCAAFGGLPAAGPNPTGAVGVGQAAGVTTVNVSGCPPNPVNLIAVIVDYLLRGSIPRLDSNGRPTFAYDRTVHDRCQKPYGCLEDMGCQGKKCRQNCPQVMFNDATGWCIQAGHHCIGCAEPDFWDGMAPFYSREFSRKFYEDYGFVGEGKARNFRSENEEDDD